MLDSNNAKGFPWFPICAGIVGLGLQNWLFSMRDGRGLLPQHHISGILTFVLFAITMAVIFIGLSNVAASGPYSLRFPRSALAGVGTILGAAGMCFSTFMLQSSGALRILLSVLTIANTGALFVAALCRFRGIRLNCLLYAVTAVFLVFRIMACCRDWGREPQLMVYFFPLLACLFLLLSCYFRSELIVKEKNYRQFIFFTQAAVFCCLLALACEDWLFYLSAGIWMATDFCILTYYGQFAA